MFDGPEILDLRVSLTMIARGIWSDTKGQGFQAQQQRVASILAEHVPYVRIPPARERIFVNSHIFPSTELEEPRLKTTGISSVDQNSAPRRP